MRARFSILLASTFLIAGCSDAMYRKWADAQVDHIVRERSTQALHYTPDVEAPTNGPIKPAAEAFKKVPVTTMPPPTTTPVEPSDLKLSYGKLGPERLFPDGVSAPQVESLGLESATKSQSRDLLLGPPRPGKPPLRLDLFGSLRYAVQHNRDYQSQMENLYLAALDVTLQRHLFEPIPTASTGLKYAGAQGSADYAAALTAFNSIGVKQQLPYGGNVAANATVDFVRAISSNAQNGETANIALTASIPLWRGAGLVNLEPLILSEREMVYAVRTFETFRRGFVVTVASQYFNLLSAQVTISNQAANLVAFKKLTERSEAMNAAGRLAYIDVQRALQQQVSAEQGLITAQSDYQSRLDDFKLLLAIPVDQPLDVVAQELSVHIPQYTKEQVVDLATTYRLDLQTAQDQVEDSQRAVGVASNELAPDLNFNAGANFGNPTDTPASHLNNDQTNYSASIQLDLPLDRLAERNAYRRTLITLERARRSYLQLRDQVAADARQSLRLIQSAQVSLDIQQRGIELAKLTLENANELLREGKEDNRNYVDAQNALLSAQDAYEGAKTSLQIQILGFLRDTGTLRLDPDAGAIGAALDRIPTVNEHRLPG